MLSSPAIQNYIGVDFSMAAIRLQKRTIPKIPELHQKFSLTEDTCWCFFKIAYNAIIGLLAYLFQTTQTSLNDAYSDLESTKNKKQTFEMETVSCRVDGLEFFYLVEPTIWIGSHLCPVHGPEFL